MPVATDTLPQTPHRAGALCTGYALFIVIAVDLAYDDLHVAYIV